MRRWVLAATLPLLLPATVRCQTVEITPIAGYRFGGTLSVAAEGAATGAELEVDDAAAFGAQLGLGIGGNGELELLYARQNSRLQTAGLFTGVPVFDLDLETWQLCGNYLFGEDDARVRPYVGVGLGLTRLLPAPAGLDDETRFSASFAAGVKLWADRHFGFRVEGRGFFTVLDSDSRTFCGSASGCVVRTTGSELSQAELRGGLVLRF